MKKTLENVEVYKPITLFNKVIGITLVVYGAGTILLPTGSVVAIAIGCAFLGIDPKKLMESIRFYGKKFKDWAYANRNLKLIKRTIKARFM